MLKHWLKSLLVLAALAVVGAGCVRAYKEDGKTKIRPGTVEIHHNEPPQNQAVNEPPATQP